MKNTFSIPKPEDAEYLCIYFTGGFRTAQRDADQWQIEPILRDGQPCAMGFLSKSEMRSLAKANNFSPIAFHRFGWLDGTYYSSWTPIHPEHSNHLKSPASLWGNIHSNIFKLRNKDFFRNYSHKNIQDIADRLDERSPEEALTQYIRMSLQGMDNCIQHIAENYNEQLVHHMRAGRTNGERSDNTLSKSLYANIHSFFLHFGAARDYLASLIAHRANFKSNVDDMARLLGKIDTDNMPDDKILGVLLDTGNLAIDKSNPRKLCVSGNMYEINKVRKMIVHQRPYGSKFSERFGKVIPESKDNGIYRYIRPICLESGEETDVLDFINHHYKNCLIIFDAAAKRSGYNFSELKITDADVKDGNIK